MKLWGEWEITEGGETTKLIKARSRKEAEKNYLKKYKFYTSRAVTIKSPKGEYSYNYDENRLRRFLK